jgi:hypothetical protein
LSTGIPRSTSAFQLRRPAHTCHRRAGIVHLRSINARFPSRGQNSDRTNVSNAGETTTSLEELTDNPGNGIIATDGSILLVSSVDPDPKDADIFDSQFGPTACDPATPKPAPQLLAWSTHSQVAGEITEEEFTQITLTSANLKNAAALCGFLEGNGSGPGVCDCSEEG